MLSLPSIPCSRWLFCFFFFNDTATTEIYTLSLHDALPIHHVPTASRVERRAALLQPHQPIGRGESRLKGWLHCRERKLFRAAPELWGEGAHEQLPVGAGNFEHPVRKRLPHLPFPVGTAPVYPVVVHPCYPNGAVGQGSPLIRPAEDPPLEPGSRIALDLGYVERCQSGDRVDMVQPRRYPHHR